jgi:hypothetical protein
MPSTILRPNRSSPIATTRCSPLNIVPSMKMAHSDRPTRERLRSCSSFFAAGLYEVFAHRAFLHPVGIDELLHYFFVAPHRQTVHDLSPYRLLHQRAPLKQLIAAEQDLAIVLPIADAGLLNGHSLPVDDYIASFGAPAVGCSFRIGLGPLAGKLARLRPPARFRQTASPRAGATRPSSAVPA